MGILKEIQYCTLSILHSLLGYTFLASFPDHYPAFSAGMLCPHLHATLSYNPLLGGATLIFSVELLELQKKPLISLPQGTGFWTYVGLLVLFVGLGYELYRRATKQTEEVKKQKKSRDREHPVRKGQSKKKK